jgi:hypothetical protein
MRKNRLAFYLMVMLGSFSVGWADGFSTPFVDVVVLDVPLGSSRRVESWEHHSLLLRNTGDSPMHVRVEVRAPTEKELKKPAKPLPSTEWIRIKPDEFDLAPKEEMDCNVIIEVPKKWKYRRRWYQAMIFSKGAPVDGEGITLSAGLLSRLRFKTGI